MGVKPAFEDVDADGFLAFPFAELKTKSSPTAKTHEDWTEQTLVGWGTRAMNSERPLT